MDCGLPGSSVHGISQARILEWVAIFFFRASNQHLLHWQSSSLSLSHTWEAQKLYYKTVFPIKQCLGSDICEMNELSLSVYGLGFNYLQMLLAQSSVQFSSVAQSWEFSSVQSLSPVRLFATWTAEPGLPVHHQLLELTQTHVHRVGDAIQTSHPLSAPSPALNLSQHQGLFQWVGSSHQVAKVLEFQLPASVLSMNIQDWFPLASRGWISL